MQTKQREGEAETATRKVARARRRAAGSARRAPLPRLVPRALKRQASRAKIASPPAHIRVLGVELDPDDRAYIRLKLGRKLGKFARSIERVTVRAEDVNGPRGGVDQRCSVKVVLSGLSSVVVEAKDASIHAAVDAAVDAAARAVAERLRRRQIAPRRPRRRGLPT
jgi:ribosome-associated translation inhibitor RaiA